MAKMSDAEWYIKHNEGLEREYYDTFFEACHRFRIVWSNATPIEKAFIEEVTRVTFEHSLADRGIISRDAIRPTFSKRKLLRR